MIYCEIVLYIEEILKLQNKYLRDKRINCQIEKVIILMIVKLILICIVLKYQQIFFYIKKRALLARLKYCMGILRLGLNYLGYEG